jgi:nitrate reductase assembly molybdenum cofactor insertion protein NarJ
MTAQNLTVLELADFDQLAERLSEHADGIENIAARLMADDMKLAAKLIDTLRRTGVIHSAVALF